MLTNLDRTAAALNTFDTQVKAAWDELDAMSNAKITDGHVYKVANLERRLGTAVGHAFGLDTADRNAMDTCEECVRPDQWLRGLVAEWEAANV